MKFFQVIMSPFVLVTFTVILFCVIECQDHYNYDWGKNFCKFVPTPEQLEEYRNQCQNCTVFWKPLQKLRDCCAIPCGLARDECLEETRVQELEVIKLFLNWKEPEHKDDDYKLHLKQCGWKYENPENIRKMPLLPQRAIPHND